MGWLVLVVIVGAMVYSAGRKRGQRDSAADVTARVVSDLLNRTRGGGL